MRRCIGAAFILGAAAVIGGRGVLAPDAAAGRAPVEIQAAQPQAPEGPRRAPYLPDRPIAIVGGLPIDSNVHIVLNPMYSTPDVSLPLDQSKARWEQNWARMEREAVEKGKLADIIVVAGNPLDDMEGALKRVTVVIKGGVRYK